MNVFENFGFSHELLTAIKNLGITEPTEIQVGTIPDIMKGKDVIGESATGSGKTLAFGCGIIDNVMHGKGIQALILTPTRELAEQVKGEFIKLSAQKNLSVLSIYGGVAIGPQIDQLPRADVVVATPGRLLDHLERRTIDLSRVKSLVLDEADRMFDMGFIEDVERILSQCPKKRQNLFFSATISERVKDLASKFMTEPKLVFAKKHVDPSKLKQIYYDIPRNIKLSLLVHLLGGEQRDLVMVFCNSRSTVDFVVKNLKINHVNAIAIHGGLTQNKRTRTIDIFNGGKVGVLVCTDVAARGLHIDNVSHIYNYDIPRDSKDYVHRIGRTARAGEEGKVINLLCDFDYDNFSKILSDYREFTIEKIEKPHVERIMSVRNPTERPNRGNFRKGPGRGGRSNSEPRRGYGHRSR